MGRGSCRSTLKPEKQKPVTSSSSGERFKQNIRRREAQEEFN